MAGWFDFVNGQTVPASRVQDYLMDQSVMVFASAAARAAAVTPTEGMVTYLLSTGELYVRTSTAWVRVIDDNNTATIPPRRNVLINGSFEINQRNFTSTTANGTYGFDRWFLRSNDTLATYSTQAFAPGDLEAAGGFARNYARIVTTGQTAANTLSILRQSVEGVRTLAGKTATYSFWARAGSGNPKINISFTQFFGGGSANVETVGIPKTLSTSWQRYSFTLNVPSIAGKTIGSGGFDALVTSIFVSAGTDYPLVGFGIQSNTFDIWGVQLEEGPVATPFVRAGGTLQGELAACQRYYQRFGGVNNETIGNGGAANATQGYFTVQHKVPMRTAPSVNGGNLSNIKISPGGGAQLAVSSLTLAVDGSFGSLIGFTCASGLTANAAVNVFSVSNGFIEFNSEL